MPLIGRIFGKVDFTNMFVSLTGMHFDIAGGGQGGGRAHA